MKKLDSVIKSLGIKFRSRALVLFLAVCIPISSLETASASNEFDAEDRLMTTSTSSCVGYYISGLSWKLFANSSSQITKVQLEMYLLSYPPTGGLELYSDLNGDVGSLIGSLNYNSARALTSNAIATFDATNPLKVSAGRYYWLKVNTAYTCLPASVPTFSESGLSINLSSGLSILRFTGGYFNRSINMAIFGKPSVTAPSAPASVIATSTGKRSATVSFAAPASDADSAITSYTATSTPGGFTQTLTQATGGTFNFDGLQPGTAYTFAVTATNANGTSAAATSNSVTTTPLVVASLSSISFADDGTGTGGKIIWSGTSIDAVLYTGSAAYYPGPYNYGAFTSGWNGRIRNLTADTSYTVSLFVVSADGVGESKSLTFKTSAALPAPAGAASATISRADEMTAQLPKLFAWIDENTFVEGEGNRMKMMLNKFDALVTSPHRSHIKVPISRVSSVVATSLTPLACSVVSATAKENAGLVKALSGETCTISYTVSGGSRAPATMIKDFVFKKFAK